MNLFTVKCHGFCICIQMIYFISGLDLTIKHWPDKEGLYLMGWCVICIVYNSLVIKHELKKSI